jgi:hypothetical protein
MTREQRFGIVVSGILGALLFVVNFLLASGLTVATGIPFLSVLITGVTIPFTVAIAFFATRMWTAPLLTFIVYHALAIPTVIGGPPGPHKLIVGFAGGIVYAFVLLMMPRRRIAPYLAFTLSAGALLGVTVVLFRILNLPGLDKLFQFIWVLFAVYVVEGILGTFLAEKFHRRYLATRLHQPGADGSGASRTLRQ